MAAQRSRSFPALRHEKRLTSGAGDTHELPAARDTNAQQASTAGLYKEYGGFPGAWGQTYIGFNSYVVTGIPRLGAASNQNLLDLR